MAEWCTQCWTWLWTHLFLIFLWAALRIVCFWMYSPAPLSFFAHTGSCFFHWGPLVGTGCLERQTQRFWVLDRLRRFHWVHRASRWFYWVMVLRGHASCFCFLWGGVWRFLDEVVITDFFWEFMGVGQSDDPFDAGVGIWFHVRYNDNEKE